MKTVKQLADELGVAKQTINNNKPEDMEYIKKKNINYIDEDLEKVITEKITGSPRYQDELKEQEQNNHNIEENEVSNHLELFEKSYELQEATIQDLREEIKRLHHQLATKDEQINNYSELLRNQQILTLKHSEKIEELENTQENQNKENEQEQNYDTSESHSEPNTEQESNTDTNNHNDKKGLFSRLFGR